MLDNMPPAKTALNQQKTDQANRRDAVNHYNSLIKLIEKRKILLQCILTISMQLMKNIKSLHKHLY